MRRKLVILVLLLLSGLLIGYWSLKVQNSSCGLKVEKSTRLPACTCNSASPNSNISAAAVVARNKFSIIIPTYKRMMLLTRVLRNYCGLPSHVDLIIVVWNDLSTDIPESLLKFACNSTLILKKEKFNSLNNRFLPYPEIKTEAVLSADDDLLISHDDLIFQFEVWQRFKHLLVGFAARRHIEQPPGSGKYTYVKKVSREDPRYSFILTTSAMFHVKYLAIYQKRLPVDLRKFIDENMNCEDILINAIIAEQLNAGTSEQNCPALLIEQKGIRLIERQNVGYEGLWHRKKHKGVREACLSLIAHHFNGIPFGYSSLKVTHVFPYGLEIVQIT